MKKLSLLVLLVLVALALPAAFAAFTDVDTTCKYKPAIDFLEREGIIQGYPDGTFKPNQTVTRAEFAKVLLEATHDDADLATCDTTIDFSDVSSDAWFATYVCEAEEDDIVKGYADNTFRPYSPITFAEALKVAIEAYGFDVPESDSDVWWQKYFDFARQNGLSYAWIKSPTEFVTRGEMAEMIYWLYSLQNDKARCTIDADCAKNQMCITNYCQDTAECTVSGDCPSGYDCVSGVCKQSYACYANSDCPTGYSCVSNKCKTGSVNAECVVDADCLSTQICTNNKCETTARCNLNSDCAQGYSCIDLQCTQTKSCSYDTQCATGFKCEGTNSHRCHALDPCATSDDCPTLYQCSSERCQLPAKYYNR